MRVVLGADRASDEVNRPFLLVKKAFCCRLERWNARVATEEVRGDVFATVCES